MDIAFVLVKRPAYPDPTRVVAAARRLGIELVHEPSDETPCTFGIAGGGHLIAMLMEAPHPDAPRMPVGPTSPPSEEVAAAPAHFVVVAQGLTGPERERDRMMARLTAAIVETTEAVAAMLGHGVVFHRANAFAQLAALGDARRLPVEILVDLTVARESDTRMSFLTHGLARYGREELYVTCPIKGKRALDFIYGIVRWMLADPDKHFPTGDTVGRTADEKIEIQRVPSPNGEGGEVIKLDLPG